MKIDKTEVTITMDLEAFRVIRALLGNTPTDALLKTLSASMVADPAKDSLELCERVANEVCSAWIALAHKVEEKVEE